MSGTQESERDGAGARDDLFVVGIGASAGGVKALTEFFSAVPPDSGMAYVVVLHLSPEYESQLAEVLSRVTSLPVSQVRATVAIEPGHVYVIPPNKSLALVDGTLAVSHVTGYEERRAPIDLFFRTLGSSKAANCACVVLTGTGTDGTMGLKRVKELGGIAIAQDPAEAEYPDMPRSAIATGLVDFVLPVREIPARVHSYRDHGVELPLAEAQHERLGADERALRSIFAHLRVRTGHDFTNYKRGTVLRRLQRRMNVREVPDLSTYAGLVERNPEEAQALLNDLLISVTNFFRDADAFRVLEERVIPRLFEAKTDADHVRAWVVGCATGEEAYSVAMLLAEQAGDAAGAPSVQVFATDIDERALAVARGGFYSDTDVADISPERLRRFFVKERGGYRVRRELRETVLFALHNVIKDPPFSHLDLASCRNLLIYLNRSAQERVVELLHFALKPGGYLFLGGAESADGDNFITLSKEHHIFQSRAVAPRLSAPLPDVPAALGAPPARLAYMPRLEEERVHERLSYLDLHQRLLEQFAPPSVLVNENLEVVHLSDRAGRYMQVPGGEPTAELLKLARPELRLELRTALHQALQQRASVQLRALHMRLDDGPHRVDVTVRPVMREGEPPRGLLLVLFEESADAAPSDDVAPVDHTGSVAQQLEDELSRVRGQLRASVEQHELQQEELRASNEELQAINEELRSTAEELETSKEELQSVNEELTTVNQELKIKIDELSHTNNDFQNLINSTEIATIFLDRALRIKLFTPRAREVFNLIPSDVGRSVLDITHSLVGFDLRPALESVLDTLHTVEREVSTADGRWYMARLLPYRTVEDRIDGAVATFINVTERKRVEQNLRLSEERYRLLAHAAANSVWRMDADARALLEVDGRPVAGDRLEGAPAEAWRLAAVHADDRESVGRAWERAVAARENFNLVYRAAAPSGEVRFMHTRGVPLLDERGSVREWIGTSTDITEQRRAEERLRASEERLRLLVESATDFAILTISHDSVVSSWSPGAQRVFGYAEEEIVGSPAAVLYTREDRERGVPEQELRAAERDGRAEDERWHVRKDGTLFYASGVLRPLDGDGAGFVKIARDLTWQKRSEEELRRAHEALGTRIAEATAELRAANEDLLRQVRAREEAERRARDLLQQIVSVQEDERRRISRDLHDQLGQQLTALRLNLEVLRDDASGGDALRAHVEQTLELAERLEAEVDFLAWELRPAGLDELGLRTTLANFVEEWSRHFGIPAEFHSAGLDETRLASRFEINLYRIAQEALNNVQKHAAATRVAVLLERRGGDVVLVVEDDGNGFETDERGSPAEGTAGLGLVGMRERAALLGGTLEVESALGEGTTVFARVPNADSSEAGGEAKE